jgi:threonine dehydratase
MTATIPTFQDVEVAARRIAGHCLETPLLESPALNQMLGGRLLLKCENLQYTGSFKLRGAINRLAAMTDDERARGVVARSSGNHGLALAYCAGPMRTTVVVVAPDTAPRTKIERIRAYGARVEQAPMHAIADLAAELTAKENRISVPPADDPWIVAGAGTVGLELAAQAAKLGATLDALLVCCSGGGLTSGCMLALGVSRLTRRFTASNPLDLRKWPGQSPLVSKSTIHQAGTQSVMRSAAPTRRRSRSRSSSRDLLAPWPSTMMR